MTPHTCRTSTPRAHHRPDPRAGRPGRFATYAVLARTSCLLRCDHCDHDQRDWALVIAPSAKAALKFVLDDIPPLDPWDPPVHYAAMELPGIPLAHETRYSWPLPQAVATVQPPILRSPDPA